MAISMCSPRLFLFVFITCALTMTQAQNMVALEEFCNGLQGPVDIANAGGPDLYIAERHGRIERVDSDGNVASFSFLDIRDRVVSGSGEQGLLGIVFHPSFPDSPYLYCNYTGVGGTTYISRFDVISTMEADSSTELILLTYSQPFANHNGGDLDFDANGFLLIASGDGGSGGDPQDNAQDSSNFLGKILRIDVDGGTPYAIPPDNHFVGVPGARQEIWAYGLRNPWRIDYDPITNAVFTGDVGQNIFEEVNRIDFNVSDPNLGWRCYEGYEPYNLSNCNSPDTIAPIYIYQHGPDPCSGSITGGVVYRGSDMPEMYGKYFFSDYCHGFIMTIDVDNGNAVDTVYEPSPIPFSTFGTDAQGRLYIAQVNQGRIFRLKTEADTNFIHSINLDGAQAGTGSGATGYGYAIFDSLSRELTVSGYFTELDGNPTVAHVHRGAAGSSGGVVFGLTLTTYSADSTGFYGSGILSQADANNLLAMDGLYVNIHSSLHGGGEIRGQIILEQCPSGFKAQAPVLIAGQYNVDDASVKGQLNNDWQIELRYQNSVDFLPGFEMTIGTILETIQAVCP